MPLENARNQGGLRLCHSNDSWVTALESAEIGRVSWLRDELLEAFVLLGPGYFRPAEDETHRFFGIINGFEDDIYPLKFSYFCLFPNLYELNIKNFFILMQ